MIQAIRIILGHHGARVELENLQLNHIYKLVQLEGQ